jgi:hypothetical protein
VEGDEVDDIIDAAYQAEAAMISVAPKRLVDPIAVEAAREPRGPMSSAARTDVRASFIRGDSEELGRILEPEPGSGQLKAAAVEQLAVTACRFSRMSGILPFANAVVLFVNLDTTGGYDNQFIGPEAGLHLTWFAQATQTPDSPIIQRMLASSDDDDEVLLCVREPGEPYVFAGRLEATEVFPKTRPVKIVWRLLDAPVLAGKQEWRDLLNLGGDAGGEEESDDEEDDEEESSSEESDRGERSAFGIRQVVEILESDGEQERRSRREDDDDDDDDEEESDSESGSEFDADDD